MSTRIVFDGGGEVLAAQGEPHLINATRPDHSSPVTL
jgi:hypothetical protein